MTKSHAVFKTNFSVFPDSYEIRPRMNYNKSEIVFLPKMIIKYVIKQLFSVGMVWEYPEQQNGVGVYRS